MTGEPDIIQRIVEQNLRVYEVSESRLREDVSQEAQVASDYRGRLVYELLQNADDAMADGTKEGDRVVFLVTDEALWIANSGRALTDDDVQGLCGLGASSKVDSSGIRRASIGHKGLGFKSVLEITSEPVVYSTSHCFRLGADHARALVDDLWRRTGRAPAPPSVPLMRFPKAVAPTNDQWTEFVADGLNTAFRFPFRPDLAVERRVAIAELLIALPLTTVLFLKHLESIEVRVERSDLSASLSWTVTRRRAEADGWLPARGLGQSGTYRVEVRGSEDNAAAFLVAHDADVPIGSNREGLTGPAWEGVELTEVSVAALEPGESPMPEVWRHLHVFLPTAEPCPYPILVNGAFNTDLSRQQVPVSADPGDYNSHLVREAARLCRVELLPQLRRTGIEAALAILDRGHAKTPEDRSAAAGLFHAALCEELAEVPLLPTEAGEQISIRSAVVPPPLLGDAGALFRQVLGREPVWEGHTFPTDTMCSGTWAGVIVDHGAQVLEPAESLEVLASQADAARSSTTDHPSGGFEVDPLLTICELLWRRTSGSDRFEVECRAREVELFPVTRNDDRTLIRVAVGEDTAFYPPRSARHDLPLHGLRFMCHSICWGALNQNERLRLLDDQMKAWSSLFDVREFRFEEVARAAVTPALTLHPDDSALALRESLREVHALAAICQLAGRFAKPDRPLRYQRLQSDRALFPLSRLPVPCRSIDGEDEWVPAYRVYFGTDWIGDDSVEHLLGTLTDELDVHYLAPPSRFLGLLDDPNEALASDIEDVDDEVDDDEDADAAIETDERARWVAFLSWIGVSSALRLVHFQDVEDEKTGWVTTRDLNQPGGRAFRNLGGTWTSFKATLRNLLDGRPDASTTVPYLYDVHDLDLIAPIVAAAEADASGQVAAALFAHLVRHWPWYASFVDAQLALVDHDKSPGQRTPPPRAKDEELVRLGDNLWLHRLQRRGVCPTSHGPMRPDRTWLPSPELDRQFGGRRRQPHQLLPVLEIADDLPPQVARSVAHRLAVRTEPSPSTFGLDDARLLCERLRDLYTGGRAIDTAALRDVIKPVYRQLFVLLSGQSSSSAAEGELSGVPLLAETSAGLQFLPSTEVLFSRTPGLRERSGLAGAVPTFVLEAEPASFAPLSRLFSVRSLEQALEWKPDPGECPLSDDELEELRDGLRQVMKPLLARIRVERNEARDTRVLREFVERVEPVDALEVSCEFDGSVIEDGAPRSYFVQASRSSQPLQAFVVWNEPQAWPPPADAANSLAMALADALGLNLVETFLAFLRSDDDQRQRLLTIAGALDLLSEIETEEAEAGEEPETGPPDDGLDPTAAPESGTDEAPPDASPGSPKGADPVPLRRFADLTIDGVPILIEGEHPENGQPGSRTGGQRGATGTAGRRAAIGTDLSALDALGMRITVTYEILRLRRAGFGAADLLGADPSSSGSTFVVDVHTPKLIQEAEEMSPVVKAVMTQLQDCGLSRLYPGCDLLTIKDGAIDRLIELKSSTVDARVQDMSWNEWKTARSNQIRKAFWLYLVGNLRADLDHAVPFVRAINDPFGALVADEKTEHQLKRAVQLRVREFAVAEHLDLGVSGDGHK